MMYKSVCKNNILLAIGVLVSNDDVRDPIFMHKFEVHRSLLRSNTKRRTGLAIKVIVADLLTIAILAKSIYLLNIGTQGVSEKTFPPF